MTFKPGDRVRVAHDVGELQGRVGTVQTTSAWGAMLLLDGDEHRKFFFQSELKHEHHLTIRHLGRVGSLWLWGWACSCGTSSGSTVWCVYDGAVRDAQEHYALGSNTTLPLDPALALYYRKGDEDTEVA